MIQALLFAKHLHRFCCWFAVPVQWIQGFNFKLRANGRTISWELLRPFAQDSPVSNFAQQHATGCPNGRKM